MAAAHDLDPIKNGPFSQFHDLPFSGFERLLNGPSSGTPRRRFRSDFQVFFDARQGEPEYAVNGFARSLTWNLSIATDTIRFR